MKRLSPLNLGITQEAGTRIYPDIIDLEADLATRQGVGQVGNRLYASDGVTPPIPVGGGFDETGGNSHTDGTNTLLGSFRRFIGSLSPSADDSAILIGRGLSGSYNTGAHAVRDESEYEASGSGLFAYASFDSITRFLGGAHYNHLRSFQSRLHHLGSGILDELAGYHFQATHVGLGTITNMFGIKIDDYLGAGVVTDFYAIYVSPLLKAANNYALYSASILVKSYHGGLFQFGTAPRVSAAGWTGYGSVVTHDTTGNFITNPKATVINGTVSLKDPSNAKLLATLTKLVVDSSVGTVELGGSATKIDIKSPAFFKSYAVSALPAATAFQRAFVTDASNPVFGSAVVGGGSVAVPVYSDGSAWKVG